MNPKLLLITRYSANCPSTIKEHVEHIKKLPSFNVDELNVIKFNRVRKRILGFLPYDLSKYDLVVLHNSVTASLERLFDLAPLFKPNLSALGRKLVLMKQDELRRMNQTHQLIDEWGIQKITTCVPRGEWERAYSLTKRPHVAMFSTFTGYVSESMRRHKSPTCKRREFDVVYRGQFPRWYYGRLGYEKYSIGEDFKRLTQMSTLRADISSRPEDRIYGKSWIRFLESGRCTLGVESGGSIFDFDGTIESRCNALFEREPNLTFQEASDRLGLEQYENQLQYGQIAPRHIEAAYTRTVQILFPGEFNGLFENNSSCLFLRRDFSNLEEILEKVKDVQCLEKIVQNAFSAVIQNEDLSYERFVQNLNKFLLE